MPDSRTFIVQLLAGLYEHNEGHWRPWLATAQGGDLAENGRGSALHFSSP